MGMISYQIAIWGLSDEQKQLLKTLRKKYLTTSPYQFILDMPDNSTLNDYLSNTILSSDYYSVAITNYKKFIEVRSQYNREMKSLIYQCLNAGIAQWRVKFTAFNFNPD